MIRRTCFPSTLRLMPVIHESTSVNSKPSLDAMTWSVQATAPVSVTSMRVRLRSRAKRIKPVTQSAVYSTARGKLPSPACGPITISMLGKPSTKMPRKVWGPSCHFSFSDAPHVDAVEGAGDRVKARRIDDDVEFVFCVARLDAGRGDALDRRLVDVDELDVRLVIDLVVAAFERHSAGAETVVLRDQLLGDLRILDPLADLARDEIGDQRVCLAVHQDVAEIAHPDAETGLAVKLLP